MDTVVGSHGRLRSLGCYNCRDVRNSTGTLSLHAVGRATDIGFLDPSDQLRNGGAAGAWLQEVCDALVVNHLEVGVQQVIYAARIWRVGQGGWRDFDGASGDHHDHAHIELVGAAAETLTAAQVAAVLPQEDDLTPEQAQQLSAIQQLVSDIRAVQESIEVPAVSPDSRTKPDQVLPIATRALQAAQQAQASSAAAAADAKKAVAATDTLEASMAALAARVEHLVALVEAGGGGSIPSPEYIHDAVWDGTRLTAITEGTT